MLDQSFKNTYELFDLIFHMMLSFFSFLIQVIINPHFLEPLSLLFKLDYRLFCVLNEFLLLIFTQFDRIIFFNAFKIQVETIQFFIDFVMSKMFLLLLEFQLSFSLLIRLILALEIVHENFFHSLLTIFKAD
jgi:hypothetical protein